MRQVGFTLIELMIVVAVIGILTMIAYPSYQDHIIRGHRSAAQTEMMDIANRQQQFFLANRAYATKDQLQATGYALPSDVSNRYSYDIDLSTTAVPSFTITFRPTGSQEKDGNLTLNSEGIKTPPEKW